LPCVLVVNDELVRSGSRNAAQDASREK
jgi:hypothetical protein